ncbi:MAG: SH3 domain-containing protein [Peptococcia bacterium]
MKRVKPRSLHNLRFFIFVLALLLVTIPVFAQEEGVVKGSTVNVRQGPGTNYAATAQVKDGQALYILSSQNNWFKVRLHTGAEGWIRSDLVDRVIKNVKVTGSTLNLRKGPGTNYNKAGEVSAGQILPVIAEQNSWYKVRISGLGYAWVAGWYTEVVSTGNTGNTGAAGNTGNTGNTGTPGTGANSIPAVTGYIKVNTAVLNVRQGPGTGYSLVTKIGLNETHNVLAQQNGWFKIKVNNMEGWVSPDYVQFYPTANTPEAPATDPTPAPPSSGVKVIGNAVNVRQWASLDAPVIGQVNAGDMLAVLNYQNSWYNVRLSDGNTGWVINWYVQPYDGTVPSRGAQKKDLLIVPVADGKTFKVVENGGKPELSLEGWSQNQYRFRRNNEETKLILELDGKSTRKYEGKVDRVGIAKIEFYPEGNKEIVEIEFDFVPVPGSAQTDSKNITTIPIGIASQSKGLSGKTIVVDPGHASVQPGGWPDPGALGSRTKIQEKDINLSIALKLKSLLEQNGAKVILTHTGQTSLSLAGRAAVANNLPADIFVSIHSNFNNKSAVCGHTTYYYAPAGNSVLYAQRYERQRLASAVQKEMVKSCGRKDNGILQDNFAVLRETRVPSILVETAYLSNWEEEQLLSQDWFRQQLAIGICNGIKNYFNN